MPESAGMKNLTQLKLAHFVTVKWLFIYCFIAQESVMYVYPESEFNAYDYFLVLYLLAHFWLIYRFKYESLEEASRLWMTELEPSIDEYWISIARGFKYDTLELVSTYVVALYIRYGKPSYYIEVWLRCKVFGQDKSKISSWDDRVKRRLGFIPVLVGDTGETELMHPELVKLRLTEQFLAAYGFSNGHHHKCANAHGHDHGSPDEQDDESTDEQGDEEDDEFANERQFADEHVHVGERQFRE